jgi:quinol monooxygenase YgiN
MNKLTVGLNVGLAIHAGKLDAFETIARAMTEASDKEPGTLAYDFYLSGDGTKCRLVERYVDANAVLAHFRGPAVQQLVPEMLESSSISSFEVYGDPGPEVTTMVAAFKAEIFLPRHGLSR